MDEHHDTPPDLILTWGVRKGKQGVGLRLLIIFQVKNPNMFLAVLIFVSFCSIDLDLSVHTIPFVLCPILHCEPIQSL